jgi:hypothetical protein
MRPLAICIAFLSLSLAAPASFAQQAKPREHPNKVYVDPAAGKIYVPNGTPLYVRLAISPEEGAKSYLLRNEASKDASQPVKPFYFEGDHGEHSLLHNQEHWLSKEKHKPISPDIFFIFEDGRAPKTAVTASEAPFVVNAGRKIFGKPVKFTVEATDDGSGVAETLVSVDGFDFSNYLGPLPFNTDRNFTFARYSVDNVGNAEKVVFKPYAIDLTPPTTTHELLNNFDGNVLSPKARIRLGSKDEKAGVKRTVYRFDDGEQAGYDRKKPLTVKALPEGDHTLTYSAVDRVRNEEAPTTFAFYLDATPPVTSTSILGDRYQGDRLYVSGRSRIEITATDNRAGVGKIKYRLNKARSRTYAEPFGLSKGKHFAIGHFAIDRVGNVGKSKTLKVTLDTRPPKAKPQFDGGYYFNRNIHYVTSATNISLAVSDDLSGVQSSSFALDDKPLAPGQESLTIPTEGLHKLSYSAVDNVNNRTESVDASVFVDNTPPEIFNHFGVEKIAPDPAEPGSEGVYPPKSLLYLAATDKHAGVGKIFFTIDAGKEQRYKAAIRFVKEGRHTVKVRALDNVGNESSRELRFAIRKK